MLHDLNFAKRLVSNLCGRDSLSVEDVVQGIDERLVVLHLTRKQNKRPNSLWSYPAHPQTAAGQPLYIVNNPRQQHEQSKIPAGGTTTVNTRGGAILNPDPIPWRCW